MAEVSVVLTSYNKPQWIGEAIESVLNQTYSDLELFVMEDNSPDEKTMEVITKYESDPRLTIYNSQVKEQYRKSICRYAHLINLAVTQMSTGKYITYLADDDIFYSDRLERMVNFLNDFPEADIVYGTQDIADIEMNIRGQRGPFGILDNGWNKVDHNSVLHTRRVFFDAGGWDEDPGTWGGSDAHFWRRIHEKTSYLMYPLGGKPTEAKRYHEESVQWLIVNGTFYT